MKRRVAIVVLAALGLVGGLSAPAFADRGPDHDWACVFVTHLDTGYCQQNPLPERLPLPTDDGLL